MKRFRFLLLASALSVLFAGVASAVPISFTFLGSNTVGGAFPTEQTFVPSLPLLGSGNIDFASGTGTLALPDHSITLNILSTPNPDARLDVSGWTQTIMSIDVLGNIQSAGGGAVGCTDLGGGGFGSFICAAASPTVAGWPPADGATAASSAVLNTEFQRITVIDNSDPNAGRITSVYTYTIVPEPGTALLLGGGLMAMAMGRKRRLS
jgi:hypothetical protein